VSFASVKKLLRTCCAALAVTAFFNSIVRADENRYQLQEGDIVFSSSQAGHGRAIIDATNSPYTHCGIVMVSEGKTMVLEAVEPVGITSLADFASRSAPGTFIAKRLRSAISPEAYQRARDWAKTKIGTKYDHQFRWSDDRLYCSELVWKIYQKAGVRLCEPSLFRSYALDRPSVKKAIIEKYGSLEALPKDEQVVAPSDLAESPLLMEVPKAS
jgi:uncharacterized protein YycO